MKIVDVLFIMSSNYSYGCEQTSEQCTNSTTGSSISHTVE